MKLEIKNASVVFPGKAGRESVRALEGIDLTINEGDFVVALGASGCGKTTLLNLMAGFIAPSSGEMLLEGRQLKGQAQTEAWCSRNMHCCRGLA